MKRLESHHILSVVVALIIIVFLINKISSQNEYKSKQYKYDGAIIPQ